MAAPSPAGSRTASIQRWPAPMRISRRCATASARRCSACSITRPVPRRNTRPTSSTRAHCEMTSPACVIVNENTVARWLPWLLAIAGFAFDVAAYWPGQMSFDSAYAWWQARGGATTDIVPPLFALAWRFCDLFVDGPGLLFALHLLLFWAGLGLLARALQCGPRTTAALMLLVAFAPVPWLLRGHVWTDVGLFSALTCAIGALASAEVRHQRRWLLVAAAAMFY